MLIVFKLLIINIATDNNCHQSGLLYFFMDYNPTCHGKYNNFVHVFVNFPKGNDKKFINCQKQNKEA